MMPEKSSYSLEEQTALQREVSLDRGPVILNTGKMKEESNCQEQRTFLRERFLRMLGYVSGTEALVHMYEKTNVTCKFSVADVDFQQIHVTELDTPMGIVPQATLRTSDIISMEFPVIDIGDKS